MFLDRLKGLFGGNRREEAPREALNPACSGQKRMEFKFPGRKPDSLDRLNDSLSGMKFNELQIEDISGYLCTERRLAPDGNELSVSYRYGLDSCVLTGTESADGFVFRMDAEVTGDEVNSDLFHDQWCAQHPSRIMRVLTCIAYDSRHAFIILHHAKR